MYPASIRWVAPWYSIAHWVNQWHSSGIPVYTGPASVNWLRVRDYFLHITLIPSFYIDVVLTLSISIISASAMDVLPDNAVL